MNTSRPLWLFLLLIFAVAAPAFAQEAATLETPAASSEAVTEETAPIAEEPAAEKSATEESAEEAEADAVVEETTEEVVEKEADEEEAIEEEDAEEEDTGTDWAGLIERAPVFLSITHHAVIHMPIALWVFGAFFVVVGVVIPSLKNQIPVACLIGGAITSVPAVLSGWWYAQEEWGDDWYEFDWEELRENGWNDLAIFAKEIGHILSAACNRGENGWSDLELITQHRWIGVVLIIASFILSIIAIIAYRRQSRLLGFIWRMGLIGLAVAVAWEGHIGGELIQGEGFLEEAFELWLHPE